VPELHAEETDTFVDVTANTVDVSAACMSLNQKSCNRSTSYSTSCMFEVNPAFASISGNPFMENDERAKL